MDFVKKTSHYRELVDAQIAAVFEQQSFRGVPKHLTEVMAYAAGTGGKRYRPVLCLAACQAVGGKVENALNAAIAIELLHTYTLIHDDLPCMDNDLLRRGMPTVHAKYGEDVAVLAGDAMQALAFEYVAGILDDYLSAEQRLAQIKEFARAAGPAGVVGGQWEDVTFKGEFSKALVDYVHHHKTADLIICATVMGAIAGGADAEVVETLRGFAFRLGVAFQVIDDILDGDDPAKANELSILRIMSVEEARALACKLSDEAIELLDMLPPISNAKAEESRANLRMLVEEQLKRTI
jgi:geranylgeranyl diphosphate synthase type II